MPPSTGHDSGRVSAPRPTRAWWAWGIVGVFVLQCIGTLAVQSGTADELGAHLPAGVLYWRSGTFAGGLANPPLGQLLVGALPVLAGTADHPLDDAPWHLLPARVPSLLLGIGTVLAIGALASRLGGATAGLAAAAAAALSPNLVAHSTLATLDLPVTAFTTFSLLLAWRWCERPSSTGLVAFAVAVGAASAIKLTGLHLIPAIALGVLLRTGSARARVSGAAALALAGLAGVVLLAWLAYGPGPGRFLLPADWVDAVLEKWRHGERGHFAYLLGERSPEGFPHYFVVALLAKTPIPTLAAAALGAGTWLRRRPPGDAIGFATLVALPCAWIFAAMSLVHRVDIGLRHVLPAYPALLVLAGVGWAWLWRRPRLGRGVAVVLASALTASAALTAPNQLAYFHVLAGGAHHGDRVLIDSNLDWGQDDARFRRWAAGRDVQVNPPRPVNGLVAANVNSIHGILRRDDLALRWVTRLPVEHRIGRCWRVVRADEGALRKAAGTDAVAALDLAWWLVGVGRATEAVAVLDGIEPLSRDPAQGAGWWRVRAEALLVSGRLAEAAGAARLGADPDLAAEIAYRSDVPVDDARVGPLVAALARRGRSDAAAALAKERLGWNPFDEAGHGDGADAVARQMELGREGVALRMAGERLARVPDDRETLALYGELTVRRKLGLTRFEWPRVDWSQ